MSLWINESIKYSFYLYTVPAYTVTENLNCYVTDKLDVSKTVEEDCHMHTGCLKRYDKKSKYENLNFKLSTGKE